MRDFNKKNYYEPPLVNNDTTITKFNNDTNDDTNEK